MRTQITDLIVFDFEVFSNSFQENLSRKVIKTALLFGFTYLPPEIRIHLQLCDCDVFEKRKGKTNLKAIDGVLALTYNVNHILVLKPECIEKLAQETYIQVIIHECVHVFQFYYSNIFFDDYIWLYESVACFLSEQKINFEWRSASKWESFINNFYNINNCYALAYGFGKLLFESYPTEIMGIIKHPQKYMNSLKILYTSQNP